LPAKKDVADGTSPQLPLEAAMARAGAFGPDFALPIGALTYWHLTGGRQKGDVLDPLKPDELASIADEATARLTALLTRFADPARPYPHSPHPARRPRFPAYAQLARALELAAADDDDGA
jgi:ATP-dependent helicase/nuclease subunit B